MKTVHHHRENTFQRKDAKIAQRAPNGAGPVGVSVASPNRTGLPDMLKSGIESLSGLAMDDVRVHYNSSKPAGLQALAYTQGTDIHVGPGQERHLPHEAWHVVQQKQGRVKPMLRAKGMSINNDNGLEHEADMMGTKALGTKNKFSVTQASAESNLTVQRVAANPFRLPSTNQNVVQLATRLAFETDLNGKSKITATQHNRSAVHGTAVKWVLNNGAWGSVPDGEVCNHSESYDSTAQNILNEIHDKKLYKAAETVKDIYEALESKNQGIGKATSTHENRLQNIIDDPSDDVNSDDITDTFNYYIYKICDYPRNLFFWPDKTGGDPDEPKGSYGNSGDWKVNDSSLTNKKRLDNEKQRLANARSNLYNALP